jgi:hypothetical protein
MSGQVINPDSGDGLKRLLVLLEGDPALRRQLEEAARSGQESLLSAFQALGARVGAAPSQAAVAALLVSADTLTNGASDELDDRVLDGVAGGTGDDAQLANVDLQNMLQKQQQTLQMMSNISKMLHDTSMAVIRKIGG